MTASAPPRRRWWFHLVALTLVLVIAFGAILAADLYLHYKLAPYAAVNMWGYRGRAVGRKRAGERRILVIGASTAFGVGFPPEDAIPAQLESRLRANSSLPVTVINLGFPGEDAFAYRADLEDFRYLKPDAVIFYGDTNQSGGATPIVLRRLSPVFKLTGYYPLIDTALREKAMALQTGDIASAYRGDKVIFRPRLAARAGSTVLGGAASVAESMHRVIGPMTVTLETAPAAVRSCDGDFVAFCNAMNGAVEYARALGLPVLVVNQPYTSDRQVAAQQAIQAMLRARFGSDRAVSYLDLYCRKKIERRNAQRISETVNRPIDRAQRVVARLMQIRIVDEAERRSVLAAQALQIRDRSLRSPPTFRVGLIQTEVVLLPPRRSVRPP